jgi:hypothetical protein
MAWSSACTAAVEAEPFRETLNVDGPEVIEAVPISVPP